MAKKRYTRIIRKDGSVGYRVWIRMGGRRVSKVFDTMRDADDFYDHKRAEKKRQEAGLELPVQEITLREYFRQWHELRLKQGKPVGSARPQEQRMRVYVLPELGHRVMSTITTAEFATLFDGLILKHKLSPATRDYIRATLHKMYNDAIITRHAARNPVTATKALRVKSEGFDYWKTREECLAYLRTAYLHQTQWFFPMAAMAIQTGLREGELIALRWDTDVSLTEGYIHVHQTYDNDAKAICERTKGKRHRWLGINQSLSTLLTKYRQARPQALAAHGRLLFSYGEDKPVTPRRVLKIHDKVCQRAGVRPIRFHDLRHQFATLFVRTSGNRYSLQRLMGHSDAKMTERYAHLDSDFLMSQARVVEMPEIADLIGVTVPAHRG